MHSEETTPMTSEELDRLIETAKARLATWKRMYMIWTSMHYGLSIFAILATILVGVLPSAISYSRDSFLYAVLSILASLFVFLLAFTSPSKQARSYIAAWRTVDKAMVEPHSTTGTNDVASRITLAIFQGEDLLSGKDPF